MKQKWFELTRPQRVMILIQAFLILLFFILTCTVGLQRVIKYQNEYLRCRTDGEVTTYSGRIDGQKAVFTVSPGPVVEYALGDTQYGPYTVVFDPTAVLDEEDKPFNLISTQSLVGVELWEGEARLFRGAYQNSGTTFYLVDADGEMLLSDGMFLSLGTGTTAAGKAPGPYTILKLAIAPNAVRRGSFGFFFLGALVCVLCAFYILYADALFRWNLRFIINDPENAEPSDWELFSRWISWVVLTIAALAIFIIGLNCG
ncbi:MAG: hypothetical protein ACI4O5_03570 [Oscillospiraceae bacterium]